MSTTKLRGPVQHSTAFTSRPNALTDLLKLIRPNQWVKNVFVFPGLLFGARRSEPDAILAAVMTFVAFCLISSCIYAINDVLDREEDRLHPRKRNRPVASGRVSGAVALAIAVVLAAGGLTVAGMVHRSVLITGATYIVLMIAYNVFLKHQVILDVMTIAIGFLLRAIAGAFAVQVEISPWLLVCTFTLCLFLGFGKRQCELAAFESKEMAGSHRATLLHYSPHLLSHLLTTSAGIAILTFLFYTLDPHTQERFHLFVFTTPLVFYGVFRYTMLVQGGRVSGPNEVLLADRPFLLTVIVWTIAAIVIVYAGEQVESVFRNLMGLPAMVGRATTQPAM